MLFFRRRPGCLPLEPEIRAGLRALAIALRVFGGLNLEESGWHREISCGARCLDENIQLGLGEIVDDEGRASGCVMDALLQALL